MFVKSCCLLLFIFSECLTTKITRLEVPAAVRLGAAEDVAEEDGESDLILDCEYELDSDHRGLVVKWRLNNELVYQWIEEQGLPIGVGLLKSHLDLKHNVSDIPEQRYRAMRILNPVPALSGDYTCTVSTFFSEDVQTKRLLFFDPGQGPTLQYVVLEAAAGATEADDADKTVQLDCDVAEVYPAPELTITVDGVVVNQTQVNYNGTDGRYNASASASVRTGTFSSDAELRCELVLPGTPYNSTHVLTFSGSPEAAEAESARPPAVGAGSPWAAGGAGAGASACAVGTMLMLVAALHRLL